MQRIHALIIVFLMTVGTHGCRLRRSYFFLSTRVPWHSVMSNRKLSFSGKVPNI